MKRLALLLVLALVAASPACAQVAISALPAASTPLSGVELVPLVQGGVTKNVQVTNLRGASGVGTSGAPVNGNLTKFSGPSTITNGNLSGDCTTSGTLTVTCTKTNGVNFAPSATTDATNAGNISSGTLPAPRLPAVNLQTGSGSHSLTGNSEIFVCTSTCSITPPVPAAGVQFCVENDATVTTVITMVGNTGVFYQKAVAPGVANGYGSSGGTMTSGGATGDAVCLLGRDATHYLVPSFGGTWTNS